MSASLGVKRSRSGSRTIDDVLTAEARSSPPQAVSLAALGACAAELQQKIAASQAQED
jgi:hypothetical protein